MQQELGLLTHLVTATATADPQAWQSQMLLLFQLLLPATGEVVGRFSSSVNLGVHCSSTLP